MGHFALNAGDVEEVVQRHLVIATELGQGPDARFFDAQLDVAEVGVGDARVGFDVSEGSGASEALQEFSDGRALPGFGLRVLDGGFVQVDDIVRLTSSGQAFYSDQVAPSLGFFTVPCAIISVAAIVPTTIEKELPLERLGQV